ILFYRRYQPEFYFLHMSSPSAMLHYRNINKKTDSLRMSHIDSARTWVSSGLLLDCSSAASGTTEARWRVRSPSGLRPLPAMQYESTGHPRVIARSRAPCRSHAKLGPVPDRGIRLLNRSHVFKNFFFPLPVLLQKLQKITAESCALSWAPLV